MSRHPDFVAAKDAVYQILSGLEPFQRQALVNQVFQEVINDRETQYGSSKPRFDEVQTETRHSDNCATVSRLLKPTQSRRPCRVRDRVGV